MIYLIGSLRNPQIPIITQQLTDAGHEVFSDWFAAGPTADDAWMEFEKSRGYTLAEALGKFAAQHVMQFDLYHLNRASTGVLVMPAGKSGHMELGYLIGQGKAGYVLFDSPPERWDVLYALTQGVFYDMKSLIGALQREKGK